MIAILLRSFFVVFTGYECDDRRFSIIEGQCVNPAVPGAIPNWAGAPTYRLLDPTPDLFRAPLCQANKSSGFKNERLYENTCRCAQGDDAVEFAADGSIRGNCTGYVYSQCSKNGEKIVIYNTNDGTY